MRTDDLISAIAADRTPPRKPMARSIIVAALLGGMISLGIFIGAFGVRPDWAAALATWRFDLKLAVVTSAVILALLDCIRLAKPSAAGFASRFSFVIPVVLAGAVGLELALVPADTWSSRLVGTNSLVCLVAIPTLAVVPLAAAILAMRTGAPASPLVAGAAVGRLAAATAAALYALHCFDDSPLFVATWYSLATIPTIAVGALAGRYMLRW